MEVHSVMHTLILQVVIPIKNQNKVTEENNWIFQKQNTSGVISTSLEKLLSSQDLLCCVNMNYFTTSKSLVTQQQT